MARKESQQLGITFGKANHLLKLKVLLSLLVRLGENYCYRCKKEIQNPSDLSLDHIQPWRGTSTELFWDLNNISYSHKRCNKPHRIGIANRKVAEYGKAWCGCCKEFLAEQHFSVNEGHWNGLDRLCKWCNSRRGQGRTKNNKHPHELLVENVRGRKHGTGIQPGRPAKVEPIRIEGARKICARCKLDKSHNDFPFKNGKPQSQCKTCRAEYLRNWYKRARIVGS